MKLLCRWEKNGLGFGDHVATWKTVIKYETARNMIILGKASEATQ